MRTLPPKMVQALAPFAPLFSRRVWQHAQVLLVGAILVAGRADADTLTMVVGFFAVVLGAANVVGGFVVTDRMLEMFKSRERPKKPDET